jgi:dynein heavy chain
MLVSVNDLLASGEIPELFATEDRDEIVNAMRGETKSLGLVDSSENCWATFINKARRRGDGGWITQGWRQLWGALTQSAF